MRDRARNSGDGAASKEDDDGEELGDVDEEGDDGENVLQVFAPMASSDDPEGNAIDSAEDLNGSLTEVSTQNCPGVSSLFNTRKDTRSQHTAQSNPSH